MGKPRHSDAPRGERNPDPQGGSFPVYLFYGEEEYLIDNAARKLVNDLMPEAEREFGVEILSGAAVPVAEINRALSTLPLFSGRRLVWLKGCGNFSSAERADAIRENLPQRGERTTVVITEETVDKRFSLYADIKKRGAIRECARLSDTNDDDLRYIYGLVNERLKADSVTISRGTLFYLVQLVGTDLRRLLAEVEKLALHAGPGGAIERPDVDRLVSPAGETAAYQLPDAVAAGDLTRALACLKRMLAQRVEPLAIMESLTRRVRFLLQAKELLESGIVTACASYPVFMRAWSNLSPSLREAFPDKRRRKRYSIFAQHPYVAYQICKAAQRLPLERARRQLNRVVMADAALKGGRRSRAEALEDLVISLCARRPLTT